MLQKIKTSKKVKSYFFLENTPCDVINTQLLFFQQLTNASWHAVNKIVNIILWHINPS